MGTDAFLEGQTEYLSIKFYVKIIFHVTQDTQALQKQWGTYALTNLKWWMQVKTKLFYPLIPTYHETSYA